MTVTFTGNSLHDYITQQYPGGVGADKTFTVLEHVMAAATFLWRQNIVFLNWDGESGIVGYSSKQRIVIRYSVLQLPIIICTC